MSPSYEKMLQQGPRHELSGLPNRAALNEGLARAIEELPGNFALLELDLNNFKSLNDTYGHLEGDQYLKNVGDIFLGIVRQGDVLTTKQPDIQPIHKAGDEFSVLLLGINSQEQLASVIERIRATLDDYGVDIAIGGAIHQPGQDIDALKEAADSAMYEDKIEKKMERYKDKMGAVAVVAALLGKYDINPRDLPLLINQLPE